MKMKEDISNKMYQEFIDSSKIEIPFNIEEIALEKINAHKNNINRNRFKMWGSSVAAAAVIVLIFLILQPQTPRSNLYSQNLSDAQKKEQFEKALKIINESLSVKKVQAKTLYNDDKFKIVLGKKI
jgi:hypothetical protein